MAHFQGFRQAQGLRQRHLEVAVAMVAPRLPQPLPQPLEMAVVAT